MTLAELATALNSLGMRVAYDHFIVDSNNSAPKPPYLVYLYAYSSDLYADNINYKNVDNMQIELYTDKKDLASEKLVEDKLKELKLPYSKTGAWIATENLYQMVYDIALI